ncbi:hypothetical protein TNCV_4073181 [Trichonephila clavipes]|uniref:Uncharacterized protein n=1 Tax=Trichonephila clavipes TaxID=2585209 RepID=A0A8X6W828_TRICX|nr:hypothetical protein TNCV_4073181 [Trichonephila clavipes]
MVFFRTYRRIRQLTIRDPFSPIPNIRSWLPTGAVDAVSTRILTVIGEPGPSNGIEYCLCMNLVSVSEGMTAVDGYGGNSENAKKQPISPKVKTCPTSGIMDSDSISFDHRTPLVTIQIDLKIDLFRKESPSLLIGRDMNRGPLAQNVDDMCTAVDVTWQRLPQPQETRLSVRLINTTNEHRLVQRHEISLRVKEDVEDVSSELDNEG